jgi:Rrf2 family transcriptional regulator, nitric oxide-sensitive transcriptional repressor
MRLLASTDFAMRILMLLGREASEAPINVETMANSLGGLSRNHLHKIVQDLAALGILRTMRGAGGGVALAKPLEDVRLGALIQALEEDQPFVECFRADGGACTLNCGCRLRRFLDEAQTSFYRSLDERTLADCVAADPSASTRLSPSRKRAAKSKSGRPPAVA